MKPIMWAGIALMILSGILWVMGLFAGIGLMFIAPIIFFFGFFIILGVVIKERLDEMKKEKGKYKQYEEEK